MHGSMSNVIDAKIKGKKVKFNYTEDILLDICKGKGFIFTFVLVMVILQGHKPLCLQAAETRTEEYDDEEEMQQIDGWHYEAGKNYYFISGEKQTGWVEVGKKNYYFSPKDGHMLTGRKKLKEQYIIWIPKPV